MSPEVAELLAVAAEVEADLVAMQTQRERIAEALALGSWDGPRQAWVAVAVHRWYSALETALSRILRAVDGFAPVGERWHRGLLERAALDVPGLRPALLPSKRVAALADLLGFRHVFRHAYAVDFNARRLRELATSLLDCEPDVSGAVAAAVRRIREVSAGR